MDAPAFTQPRPGRKRTAGETPALRDVLGWPAAGALALALAACGPEPASTSPDAADADAPSPPAVTAEDRGALLGELEALYARGAYEEGLARVREGLERSIDDAALHFHRGLFLQAAGDLDGAEAAQTLALELDPRHYPSHRALGDLARLRGNPAEAADHFGRCAAGLPDHAGCRYGLALARIDLGELEAAAGPLAEAAESLDRADVWSELGQLERRRRRLPEAIDAFSRALALDRNHLPALLGLGQALVAAGRGDEGRALLERHREQAALEDERDAVRRAAARPGAGAEVQLQLARLHRARGDAEAEEAALREALRRSPGFPPAVLALANHLLHRGGADEAAALVASLPPAMAEDPAVLFLRGTLALARGDAAEARTRFDASLAHGPWPPPVWLDAGKAWARAGFPEPAVAAFERVGAGLGASPEAGQRAIAAEAHLGLAESRRALGAPDEAVSSVQRALELDPGAGRAWLLLGVLEAERGDRQAARRAFDRALEARRLELLAAGGAGAIRAELAALAPPPEVLELFDQALETPS